METPIPFALSLLNIPLKNATATKITDNREPETIIIKAVPASAKINNGIPAPIIKETTMLTDIPKNKAFQITLRFTGWLTSSSINSLLL